MKSGSEFGTEEVKIFISRRALYSLKSSRSEFRSYIEDKLYEMVFKSYISDTDRWIKPEVKPYGEEYYEYLITYVDDILVTSMYLDTEKNQLK